MNRITFYSQSVIAQYFTLSRTGSPGAVYIVRGCLLQMTLLEFEDDQIVPRTFMKEEYMYMKEYIVCQAR